MARISIEGFEEIERAFLRQETKAIERVPVMLESAAKIIVKAHKNNIRRFDLIDTEQMLNSTKATKVKETRTGSRSIFVYPQGSVTRNSKNKKNGNSVHKVSNAEKAFIAEFGKSNQPGTRWMALANEACMEEANAEMMRIWEEG